MYPDRKQYKNLAENHDLIPVYLELIADMETPVSVLHRFADRKNAFLLESMEGNEKWGRYSFIGVEPELMMRVDHSMVINLSGRGDKDIDHVFDLESGEK
jgi:anthranilate synthase component 1